MRTTFCAFVVMLFALDFYCQDLIVNGDFSDSNDGWETAGDFHFDDDYTCCYSCEGYAYGPAIGGVPNNATGAIFQIMTIPDAATSAELTFWYSISTEETSGVDYDWLWCTIYYNNYASTLSPATLTNADETLPCSEDEDAYESFSYSIPASALANMEGEEIEIRFFCDNNANAPTLFRIDDVSLEVETAPCSYNISPNNFTCLNSSAATYPNIADVNTDNGCYWEAVVTAWGSWLSSNSDDTGDGDIDIEVEENTGVNDRYGTIQVGDDEITIMQPGQSCAGVSIMNTLSNQSAIVNGTVWWSVNTNGTSPFTYQWYKNGGQIFGATSSSYTTPLLALSDNGNTYYCYITNCSNNNNATSNTATLTVTSACTSVSITNTLSNQSAIVGGTAIWSVNTSGTSPFTYQWYKNGSQIFGATSSSYTTPLLALSDNGNTYYCHVTNCGGDDEATSNSALLTVNEVGEGQEFILNSELSHLFWPFDGSNWSDEILSDERNHWRSGEENECIGQDDYGSGICEAAHCSGEKFAQDWNRPGFGIGSCDQIVYSPLSGTVIYTYYGNDFAYCWNNPFDAEANRVYIQSDVDPTYVFTALHFKNFPLVSTGQEIAAGTAIGIVGSTGISTFAHAHFSLYKNVTNENEVYIVNSNNQMVLVGVLDLLEYGGHLNFANGCGSNADCSDECFSISPYAANFVVDAVLPGSGGSTPNLFIQSSDDLIICPGETITLTAPEATSYLWSTGAISQSINVTAAGVYSVFIDDGLGNTLILETAVEEASLSPVTIVSSSDYLCEGENAVLTSSVQYVEGSTELFEDIFGFYEWSTSETTSSIIIENPGTYSLTYSSVQGCNSSSDSIVIESASNPVQPEIIIGGNGEIATTSVGEYYQWFYQDEGNPIPGATGNSIDVDSIGTGFYLVEAFNEFGCSSLSDPIYVVGINEMNVRKNSVRIYPNPNNGYFTIQLNTEKPELFMVELINPTGQAVLHFDVVVPFGGMKKEIALSDLADGIYLLKVSTANELYTNRVVVLK